MDLSRLNNLSIKIFADGADIETIKRYLNHPLIEGFTTNPSLMRQAGIEDYEQFGRDLAKLVPNHPVSLEVFADDLDEMEAQARTIASWGKNINIKIPVTNTQGIFTGPIIEKLSQAGIKLNITAVMTVEQVMEVTRAFSADSYGIISVFAGRIADTGVDAEAHMKQCFEAIQAKPNLDLLWASPRELFNLFQADRIGCHIITITDALLSKLTLLGKDLSDYSLETVKMFYDDAQKSGYDLNAKVKGSLS